MQLIESRRTSRKAKWWRRGVILGLAAAGIGAWLAYRPAVQRYKQWKAQRALGQARQFIEKRDVANAQLALDVALNATPGNLETIRVAAGMLEGAGAAQAMRLRRAVARANPNSVEDAAALVLSSLRFRDIQAARDALSSFRPAFAEDPVAIRAALAFAIATDDAAAIDFTYGKLRALFPDDDDLKVSHALLLLKHPKVETRTTARSELEAIAQNNPKQALRIHREFAGFALANRDHAEARKQFERVLADPAATFNDRLQLANLDVLVDKKPFDPVFAQLAPLAAKSETDAAQFLQWLLVQSRAAEANRWLATLPPAIRDHRALRALQADTAAQLQDWERLISLLRDGAWGPISRETLRLVEAAQAISTRDRPTLRRETWDLVLQSAGGNLGTLSVLQRITATWRWEPELERTLWAIVRGFPDQTWAHQLLFDHYAGKKDTNNMRDVMAALQQSDGAVPRYNHDWALLTLLTNPTSQPSAAKDVLRTLHQQAPTNANYLTSHAFALAQSQKATEAVALVQKLSAAEREYPPRQPYLAYIFGVARDAAGVERAEQLAKGAAFLPEETRLFERARADLNRKPEPPPVERKRKNP